MNHPVNSSKLVLVPERSGSDDEYVVPVRRYRLARLQLDCRSSDPASRFDHLKHVYD